MRRFLLLPALALFTLALIAQSPPTKVDRESRADIYEDSYPSAASASGSARSQYRYSPTPSMDEAKRESRELAGRAPRTDTPYRMVSDGDSDFVEEERPMADRADEPMLDRFIAERERSDADWRYTYGEQGELVQADLYEADELVRTYTYDYTMDRTVRETEVFADGSNRLIREVGLDEFQYSQGPGNQPYLDNRSTNEYISVPNSTTPTPSFQRTRESTRPVVRRQP